MANPSVEPKDNTVGWSVSNAEGYNAAENVVCAAGLTQCHYKPACYDLQTSAERCGSCDISCDFLTQVWTCSCSCTIGLVMASNLMSLLDPNPKRRGLWY